MNKKLMLLIFFVCLSPSVKAIDFTVTKLKVNCLAKRKCDHLYSTFEKLRTSYNSYQHLNEIIKIYLLSDEVQALNYRLYKNNTEFLLELDVLPSYRISSFKVVQTGKHELELPSIFALRQGGYLTQAKLRDTQKFLVDTLRSQGASRYDLREEVKIINGKAQVRIFLDIKQISILSKLVLEADHPMLYRKLSDRLAPYKGRAFSAQIIKNDLLEFQQEMKAEGLYFLKTIVDFTKNGKDIIAKVKVVNNGLYIFRFKNHHRFTTEELKVNTRSRIKFIATQFGVDDLKSILQDLYAKAGYYSPEFSITQKKFVNNHKFLVHLFEIDIDENQRIHLDDIGFKGNRSVSDETLKRNYYRYASDLAAAHFYDAEHAQLFTQKIRELYVERGHLLPRIEKPILRKMEKSNFLEYSVREGVRTIVRNIKTNIPNVELSTRLKQIMQTKEAGPFNPIAFEKDLTLIEDYLNDQGRYYSIITNKRSPSLVQYRDENRRVDINIEFTNFNVHRMNHIHLFGLRRSSSKLLNRNLKLKEGGILSKKSISLAKQRLLNLGLFSKVEINTVPINEHLSDVVVQVAEKDFGIIELTPGFRSDLGPKLAGQLTYLNLDGLGKQIIFKGQVNKRVDLTTIDVRRRDESKSLVEFLTSVNFLENNIFDTEYNFSSGIALQRRRYFSFDADIRRFNWAFARSFNHWLSGSLGGQMESISQYDATYDKDHGKFQIGSLTPALTIDLRNNRVYPTSGAFFALSHEVANPAFGSQSEDDLLINYYKTTLRSRFYIPFSAKHTLAISTTLGQQENMAKQTHTNSEGEREPKGQIPNLKVYRLTGVDTVRGFADDEINRTPDGVSISELRIDEKATMLNLKIEPRMQISESMIFGLFYDAGGLFTGQPEYNKLRSSAGITFKYLTPVGTLDFDYGIKLLRKEMPDGKLEDPGRLHVSIGFF